MTDPVKRGLVASIFASVSFAIMAALIYVAHKNEPNLSVLVSSFLRISINLLVVLGIMRVERLPIRFPREQFINLFMRGLFGTVGVICTFEAIRLIGTGEAAFLHSTSGIYITLLSPLLLGQRNSTMTWLAIVGSLIGTYLLLQPSFSDPQPWGRIVALSAAICSALAMIMISRMNTLATSYAVLSFTSMATAIIGIVILFVPVSWPTSFSNWIFLICAGLFGSLGQYFLTYSYEKAPAAMVSATAYLYPVLSMLFGIFLFEIYPGFVAWCGAALILFCGLIIPFATIQHRKLKNI